MRFKTENLYLVKISKIVKVEDYPSFIRRHYDPNFRYTLAYLENGQYRYRMTFVDIYSHTAYPVMDNVEIIGIPAVVNAEPIITNTKYLTEEEALYILKELNPTYLKENAKRLRLFK